MGKVIGIVGCGVVGESVAKTFESLGHDVRRFDPEKDFFDDVTSEYLFVCINTEDMRQLEKVVAKYAHRCLVLVIKTTLRPGTMETLIGKFGEKVVYIPEFLTEATAEHDALHPDKVIIGTRHQMIAELMNELHEPLGAPIKVIGPTDAEILKLAINSFYAVKVIFANEVYDICQSLGADYDNVFNAMYLDRFIAPNHLDVWHKNFRGFGGKCLPKDSRFLLKAAFDIGLLPEVLTSAIRSNNHLQRHASDAESC